MELKELKICCKDMGMLLNRGKGITMLPEGDIFIVNDYIEVELTYCPFYGKKLKWG